jgi:hypothetical protein
MIWRGERVSLTTLKTDRIAMMNLKTTRRCLILACGVCLAILGADAPAFTEDKDKAAAAPTEKLRKHLGPVVIDYLGRITKGEAYRVGDLDHTKFGETGWIAGRVVAGKPVVVDSGPALVVGDPEKSLLMHALRGEKDASLMPPTGKLPKAIVTLTN